MRPELTSVEARDRLVVAQELRGDTGWHSQLTKLIDEIKAFADPEAGLIDGLSEAYVWGISRRPRFAGSCWC
jgi:hypothetical protein